MPKLIALQVATDLDTQQLTALCEWWNLWRVHNEQAQTTGGRLEMANAARAWDQFAKIAMRFGMTPADRARLCMPPREEVSMEDTRYFG